MVTHILIVKYISIFHLKNAAVVNDEFWSLFINLWNIAAMVIMNSANLFLPGLYTHAYEMCTCTLQDYNLPTKFDNTGMAVSLLTLITYVFVSVKIKLYKHSNDRPIYPIVSSKFTKNKLIINITLTVGPVCLMIVAFVVSYFLGKTRSGYTYSQYPYYLIIQYYFLIQFPFIFHLFAILFYLRNKNATKVLVREWLNN